MSTCPCYFPELDPATGRCAHCGNEIAPRTPAPEAPLDLSQPDLGQSVDATTVLRHEGFLSIQLPGVDWIPAFSIDPPGKLILTSHMSYNDKWTTVRHADSEVRFPDELLTKISNKSDPNSDDGFMYRDMRLDRVEHEHDTSCTCPPGHQCFNGWILHIDGRDRHLVYQIGEWIPEDGLDRGAWIARWPD